jgi:hypothetical protein
MPLSTTIIRLVEALEDRGVIEHDVADSLLAELDADRNPGRCPSCSRWPGQRWACTRCVDDEPIELPRAA